MLENNSNDQRNTTLVEDFDVHRAFPGFRGAVVSVANAATEADARTGFLRLGVPPLAYPHGVVALPFSDRLSHE